MTRESCSECGYANCPHEKCLQSPAIEAALPSSKMGYSIALDHSLDHKSNMLQQQGVHFAMMKYFGSSSNSKSILCHNWLEVRGPIKPMTSLGNYLAYRNRYNFAELD